jgi:hypothetical protein
MALEGRLGGKVLERVVSVPRTVGSCGALQHSMLARSRKPAWWSVPKGSSKTGAPQHASRRCPWGWGYPHRTCATAWFSLLPPGCSC